MDGWGKSLLRYCRWRVRLLDMSALLVDGLVPPTLENTR